MRYFTYMRTSTISAAIAGTTVLLAPAVASAAGAVGVGCASNLSMLCGLGNEVLFIINGVLVPVLFAVAFVVFLYGVAQTYIFSHGNEAEREKGHQLIMWGLIGFFVMISVWGLVNILVNTFGLGGYAAPAGPRFIP